MNNSKATGTFRINLERECRQVLNSMEHNGGAVYEFEVSGKAVTKVTRSREKSCDIKGTIYTDRTVLDL